MKKLFALLLAAVMCLSLTACGEGKSYKEALSLIENGQYAEAKAIFETIPDYKDVADYLARYTTIEVTPENWETYFTIEQKPIWEENAFGEGELFQIQYHLVMREEYTPFLIAADVAFGFTYQENCYVIEIDGANFEYGKMYTVWCSDIEAYQKEYNEEGLSVVFFCDKDLVKTTYIIEVVIAIVILMVSFCLIIIAILMLRFTIVFTISEDYKEIGILKAIGLKNTSIRRLYIIKYMVFYII